MQSLYLCPVSPQAVHVVTIKTWKEVGNHMNKHVLAIYMHVCLFVCLGYGWVGYFTLVFFFLKASVLCKCVSM